jgi:hypothetical protein
MAEIDALMRATLFDVFGERDPERRRAAIERTYHPDIALLDAEGTVTGYDALHAKVQGILDGAEGLVFAPDGPAQVTHDLGLQAWTLGPEGAPPVARGTDVALVRDGRIARLYTLLRQG